MSGSLCILSSVYKKTMPLRLEVAHPESDIVSEKGVRIRKDLGLQKHYISARGCMALCAVSRRFVVPLVPPPSETGGPSGTHQKSKKEIEICINIKN